MKFLPYFFLLCCGLWSTISFADEDYIEYRGISSNNRVTLDPVRLSNKELRWLASKKNLVIAVRPKQLRCCIPIRSNRFVVLMLII